LIILRRAGQRDHGGRDGGAQGARAFGGPAAMLPGAGVGEPEAGDEPAGAVFADPDLQLRRVILLPLWTFAADKTAELAAQLGAEEGAFLQDAGDNPERCCSVRPPGGGYRGLESGRFPESR